MKKGWRGAEGSLEEMLVLSSVKELPFLKWKKLIPLCLKSSDTWTCGLV